MIAFLQPHIPHYRTEFYQRFNKIHDSDFYCYDLESSKTENYAASEIKVIPVPNIQKSSLLFYNPFYFMKKKYTTIVLMLHFGHLSTWLLLLTKFIHKKQIILWGQGISVKRYLKEEKKPSILLRWMIALSDIVWLYTKKEKEQWNKIFPNKQIVSLNNSISGVEKIVNYQPEISALNLKLKHNINEEIILVFCARFNSEHRRTDLLIEIINRLNKDKYGYIIIGDGPFKPDFSIYPNVYDYGSIYDDAVKKELFSIANLYIQPGWVGLSVVEALAYGKPVLTFKRNEDILQCVEYAYLKNNYNAKLFNNIDDAILQLENLTEEQVKQLSINAREYVQKNLLMTSMVKNALKSITI